MAQPRTLQLLQAAIAHHQAGRGAQAEALYAQVRTADPRNFDAFHLSGFLALQQKRIQNAITLLEQAARLNPRSALCLLRLGHAFRSVGRIAECRSAAERAVAADPKCADAHFLLGEMVGKRDGMAAAIPHFRRVIELQSDAADAWANLGVALAQTAHADEALSCFDRALALDPANAQALTGRALALQSLHRPAEAVAVYDEVLRRYPQHHEARSARLLARHYGDDVSAEALFAEHVEFGAQLPPARSADDFPNDRSPDRRLRVAFLSPDLRAHSVAYFLEPLLAHLGPEQFEIVLYHDHARVDAMSARLRAHARVWREFAGHSDAAVAAAIAADAPDILIDLAGHTGFNRLPLLARRLAPVQVTYLGYPDTTGVPAMDYRFVDAISDPPGEADRRATEQLVRFAPTAWAYAPPVDAPPVAEGRAPGARVTFGCFNNFSKVSDATLRLWSDVLAAVPGSQLVLKSQGLDDPAQQPRLRAHFAAAGIDPERVRLLGRTSGIAAHLACYAQIDVALDTFPYHGTTTTCEAFWMGVPVVSLVGDRHMARVGASLLRAVGREDCIAAKPADYVKIAQAQSNLIGYFDRKALRDAMRTSVLLDHAGQAQRFGEALRVCWQTWCTKRHADRADACVSAKT